MNEVQTLKLKGKMVERDDTLESLANALNITGKTLSFKVNGKSEFSRDEIETIVKRYDLSPEDTMNIFFN